MKYEMKLQPNPFEKIGNGTKTIEIRLNDEKRRLLKIGDEIEFCLITDTNKKLKTRVADLLPFATFQELCIAFPPESYGSRNSDEYVAMYKYYSREDEGKYGVLAIKIERI